MLALRALSRDLLVAGQVARSATALTEAQWNALERIAAPLTTTGRGVAPVLRVEASLFSNVLDELRADSRTTSRVIDSPRLMSAIASATLRRNSTLNFAYPLFSEWLALDAVESDQLSAAIERIERRADEHVSLDWRWLHNHTGAATLPRAGHASPSTSIEFAISTRFPR